MSLIIKNAIPQSDFDEITKIFIPLFERQNKLDDLWNNRSSKLPVIIPDWEDNINEEVLRRYLKREKPIDTANKRNLHVHGVLKKENLKAEKETYTAVSNILSKTYGSLVRRNPGAWYNPTSYMGWHTNHRVPGTRIYVIWSTGVESSFFRYYDKENDKIITDYDDKGLTIRQFEVTEQDPLWHCVGCITGKRFSLGFMKDEGRSNSRKS